MLFKYTDQVKFKTPESTDLRMKTIKAHKEWKSK